MNSLEELSHKIVTLANKELTNEIKSIIVDVLNNPDITFSNLEGEELIKVITRLKKLI